MEDNKYVVFYIPEDDLLSYGAFVNKNVFSEEWKFAIIQANTAENAAINYFNKIIYPYVKSTPLPEEENMKYKWACDALEKIISEHRECTLYEKNYPTEKTIKDMNAIRSELGEKDGNALIDYIYQYNQGIYDKRDIRNLCFDFCHKSEAYIKGDFSYGEGNDFDKMIWDFSEDTIKKLCFRECREHITAVKPLNIP